MSLASKTSESSPASANTSSDTTTNQPSLTLPARRRISPLVWILAVGVVVRVLLWLWSQHLPIYIVDEQSYNEIATSIVQTGNYASASGELTSLRPPLYPALVAGVYAVFGVENFQAVRLLQALLSLLIVVIAYQLGKTVYSQRVGLWFAGFCCFYPSLLGFNNLVLTEVLFTLLVVLFCLMMAYSLRQTSLVCLALAGVVLGLAALTRSVVWLFPLPLAIFLLAALRGNLLYRCGAIAVFILAFAVTIAPWSIRNTRLHETFVTIDVMGGRNFMMGNYEHTPLYRSWATISMDGEKAWNHVLFQAHPSTERRTQGQIDKLAMRYGLNFVLQNPVLTIQRCIVKFFDFWGLERELVAGASQGFFGPIPKPVIGVLALLIFGSYAVALFAGIFGLFMTPPADWRIHWFLLLLTAFICGMHTLVFGHSRYHLPLMPIVLLYAAAALVQFRYLWQQRHTWRFRLAGIVCCIFFASWLWLLVAVDLDLFVKALQV